MLVQSCRGHTSEPQITLCKTNHRWEYRELITRVRAQKPGTRDLNTDHQRFYDEFRYLLVALHIARSAK